MRGEGEEDDEERGEDKLQDVALAGVGLNVGGRILLDGEVFAG